MVAWIRTDRSVCWERERERSRINAITNPDFNISVIGLANLHWIWLNVALIHWIWSSNYRLSILFLYGSQFARDLHRLMTICFAPLSNQHGIHRCQCKKLTTCFTHAHLFEEKNAADRLHFTVCDFATTTSVYLLLLVDFAQVIVTDLMTGMQAFDTHTHTHYFIIASIFCSSMRFFRQHLECMKWSEIDKLRKKNSSLVLICCELKECARAHAHAACKHIKLHMQLNVFAIPIRTSIDKREERERKNRAQYDRALIYESQWLVQHEFITNYIWSSSSHRRRSIEKERNNILVLYRTSRSAYHRPSKMIVN